MIRDIAQLKIGQKVYYQPDHYKDIDRWENGMIKEIRHDNFDAVFVVYNCGGDWKNFENYTSALTNLRDLNINWQHKLDVQGEKNVD